MCRPYRCFLLALVMAMAMRCPQTDAQCADPGSDGARELIIVSGPQGGQWNALGEVMAPLLRAGGIAAQNRAGGGVDNLKALVDGKADIGFTLYSFLGAAEAGERELSETAGGGILLLANLYPQVLYIIVRKEVADRHKLKTLQDLLDVREALRFSTLPKNTGSEFIFNMLLKNAYRTSYDRLKEQGWQIQFQSYAAISKEFLAGELDVCAYTAGPGTYLIPALEKESLDAVILSITEEKLALMTHQFMTIEHTIHKGEYASVREDVTTLGDYSCLIVREEVPENVAYRINEILWNGRSELVKVSKDMERFSPRFAVAGQNRVHPGSIRFWTSPEMKATRDGEETKEVKP